MAVPADSGPILFGADYSVYVRIARLALLEKQVAHRLVPIDVFAERGLPPDYLDRQPFGRIPAFEHGGFRLYETGAITRYIDEAFDGPALQPQDVRTRARCNQIISMADNYAYPHMVWGVYVERISKPRDGETSDEGKIDASLKVAETCLRQISRALNGGRWLAGDGLTLADLYMAPMFDTFLQTREGSDMLARHADLAAWWAHMGSRESVEASRPA